MRLVHLSDLHLGFRAFPRTERGWNLRERDLASAFRRALQEVVALRPDLVLLTGDLLDRPDSPGTALLTLLRGLETLRAGLPDAPVLAIAGERDSPLNPADPGPVAALDSLPGVAAAAGAPRAVRLRDAKVHALLVPHRAVLRPPFPEIRPDPDARWNLLLIRGDVSAVSGGVEVDPSEWDYVAVGGDHVGGKLKDHVWRAGSLERTGWDPWREATEEKGFVVYDLEERRGELHPVTARPVVDLAPVRSSSADPDGGTRRLRDVLQGVPGGIDGRILRVRLRGDLLSPREGVAPGLLAAVRARAAHAEFLVLGPGLPEQEASIPVDGAREAGNVASVTMDSRRELAPGLVAVTAGEAVLRRRAAAELATALEAHRADGTDDESFAALARLTWRGEAGPDTLLREGVLALSGAPVASPEGREGDLSAREDEPEDAVEELARLRADSMEAAGEMEAGNLAWARDRQDAESRLVAYRDRARELRARIRELERDGEEAPCPTCGRRIGEGLETLLRTLREEWEGVVQDGRWWKRRRDQMEEKPEELRRLEKDALRLQSRLERMSQELELRRERRRWQSDASKPTDRLPNALAVPLTPLAEPVLRRVLRRAGAFAHRLSEAKIDGLGWERDRIRIVERELRPRDPTPEEGRILSFSLRLGLWTLARDQGRAPGAVLFGEFAGDGDEALASRALNLASRTVSRRAVAVAVVPPGAVERVPEVIDQLLEVDEEAGGLQLRERPVGRPRITLA